MQEAQVRDLRPRSLSAVRGQVQILVSDRETEAFLGLSPGHFRLTENDPSATRQAGRGTRLRVAATQRLSPQRVLADGLGCEDGHVSVHSQ